MGAPRRKPATTHFPARSQGEESMSWDPVYRLVKKIPRGRVTTYGELARALTLSGGARAVGYAMAACPSGRGIPWHRVIGAGGKIRMPEPHAGLQMRLLGSEGVNTEGSGIDMKQYGWTPVKKKKRRTISASPKKARKKAAARR
jgi:methylated-DNA-protein-cysteine methyltransferase-like protein